MRTTTAIRTAIMTFVVLCSGVPMMAQAINASDLVGNWKSKDGAFQIRSENGQLKLESQKYNDWTSGGPINQSKMNTWVRIPDLTIVTFERKLTEENLKNMKLKKGNEEPPSNVVGEAAGTVSEQFYGAVTHSAWTKLGDACTLQMDVRWVGVDLDWETDGSWKVAHPAPETNTHYDQLRYVLPDLRTPNIQTSLEPADNLPEEYRQSVGTEIQSYFSGRFATAALGQFGAALFKPVIDGTFGAVPAETVVGKVAQGILSSVIDKGLQGELTSKQFINIVTGKILGQILGAVADQQPFVKVQNWLNDHTPLIEIGPAEFGSQTSEKISGKVDEAMDKAGTNLIERAELADIDNYLKTQCRFGMAQLPPAESIEGGLVLVDKQLGVAHIWMLVRAKGNRPALAVEGQMSLPADGESPKILKAIFRPLTLS